MSNGSIYLRKNSYPDPEITPQHLSQGMAIRSDCTLRVKQSDNNKQFSRFPISHSIKKLSILITRPSGAKSTHLPRDHQFQGIFRDIPPSLVTRCFVDVNRLQCWNSFPLLINWTSCLIMRRPFPIRAAHRILLEISRGRSAKPITPTRYAPLCRLLLLQAVSDLTRSIRRMTAHSRKSEISEEVNSGPVNCQRENKHLTGNLNRVAGMCCLVVSRLGIDWNLHIPFRYRERVRWDLFNCIKQVSEYSFDIPLSSIKCTPVPLIEGPKLLETRTPSSELSSIKLITSTNQTITEEVTNHSFSFIDSRGLGFLVEAALCLNMYSLSLGIMVMSNIAKIPEDTLMLTPLAFNQLLRYVSNVQRNETGQIYSWINHIPMDPTSSISFWRIMTWKATSLLGKMTISNISDLLLNISQILSHVYSEPPGQKFVLASDLDGIEESVKEFLFPCFDYILSVPYDEISDKHIYYISSSLVRIVMRITIPCFDHATESQGSNVDSVNVLSRENNYCESLGHSYATSYSERRVHCRDARIREQTTDSKLNPAHRNITVKLDSILRKFCERLVDLPESKLIREQLRELSIILLQSVQYNPVLCSRLRTWTEAQHFYID